MTFVFSYWNGVVIFRYNCNVSKVIMLYAHVLFTTVTITRESLTCSLFNDVTSHIPELLTRDVMVPIDVNTCTCLTQVQRCSTGHLNHLITSFTYNYAVLKLMLICGGFLLRYGRLNESDVQDSCQSQKYLHRFDVIMNNNRRSGQKHSIVTCSR